jgi:hypothetical protein
MQMLPRSRSGQHRKKIAFRVAQRSDGQDFVPALIRGARMIDSSVLPPVMPAPGSSAGRQATVGIHGLYSLQQRKSWIPAPRPSP